MSPESQDRNSPRLLDQVRELIRIRHYSIRTEQAYVQWIKRFILFHNKRHPLEMGADEVTAFLSHLAVKRNVAASTQNQALNAILFLYRDVLRCTLPWLDGVQRAKKPQRLPVVLTRDEVRALLAQMQGTTWLMAALVYGGGLRLLECLRLRVKDIDTSLGRSALRRRTASSCAGRLAAACGSSGSAKSRHHQTRQRSHAAPLVCHSSARIRL